MKPFSLSTTLKYRKQMENIAALKLSKAQQQLQVATENLEKIDVELTSLITELYEFQITGIAVEELLRFENRISWLKKEREKVLSIYESAQQNVNKKRSIAIEKSKNKKVLDRLKKKQDARWQTYQNKRENTQLDEIAVFSHARKQHSNS